MPPIVMESDKYLTSKRHQPIYNYIDLVDTYLIFNFSTQLNLSYLTLTSYWTAEYAKWLPIQKIYTILHNTKEITYLEHKG